MKSWASPKVFLHPQGAVRLLLQGVTQRGGFWGQLCPHTVPQGCLVPGAAVPAQPVPVWDGEGQEGGMPEHLQDKGFRVGQRAPVRQPRPPLPPDGLVWGRWRAGGGS